MPAQIALVVCISIILCLLIIDSKKQSKVSPAVWIPTIWMAIIASRPLSFWFFPGSISMSPEDVLLEGIPFDRNVFLALIIAGFFVLLRRSIHWAQLFKDNIWVFLLFLFFLVSVSWSDFPFVSFKRWIKAVGHLIMILIVLTDPAPVEAMKAMIKRCAYIVIPLSILLIKYYPHLGISYDTWTGARMISGVTWNKNCLGYLCLVTGFFFFWNLLTLRRQQELSGNKLEALLHVVFLFLIAWLLIQANSITSQITLLLGSSIVIAIGFPVIKRNLKNLGPIIVLLIAILFILDLSFHIFETIIYMFGRDMTLTTRTFIWDDLLNMSTNPLIGTGFESFWLGDRLAIIWATRHGQINESHNGYLELYLNSGLIGLFLLMGVIFSTYKKILKTFVSDFNYGRFQMSFLIVALVYNITEAAFRGIHLVWYMFLLISLYVPGKPTSEAAISGKHFQTNPVASASDR